LYQTESFTVLPSKVIQERYEATAESPAKIVSNYTSTGNSVFQKETPRELFKAEWNLLKDVSAFPQYRSHLKERLCFRGVME
jgi:hypothetical protein